MKNFESHYTKIYEKTLSLLKEDFEKEKKEWRSSAPFIEYQNKASERYSKMENYHEDVIDIWPKAEMLFESRKSLSSIVSAILIIIESKNDDYKDKIVGDIARIKANKAFLNILDTYDAELRDDQKPADLTLPKLTRTKDDGFTKLNQLQTAIFFKYLRESKVILGESYLTNSKLANLVSISTGFSAKSTRQSLSTNIKDYKNNDLKVIQEICESICSLIKRDLGSNR